MAETMKLGGPLLCSVAPESLEHSVTRGRESVCGTAPSSAFAQTQVGYEPRRRIHAAKINLPVAIARKTMNRRDERWPAAYGCGPYQLSARIQRLHISSASSFAVHPISGFPPPVPVVGGSSKRSEFTTFSAAAVRILYAFSLPSPI
ncbi:Protease inhibitor/seed storage/LTP family [Musa troglodytarum]|uniref:Protease inhibitor/seed storage/LTP family n=1 Tax=Musa troglodytarum TaxID=320322 RepID=A0A9E7L7L2_9LILI|nr:Protease inhibitor/seed storage/LTP family [Musa troglodytarum]